MMLKRFGLFPIFAICLFAMVISGCPDGVQETVTPILVPTYADEEPATTPPVATPPVTTPPVTTPPTEPTSPPTLVATPEKSDDE